MLIMQSKYLVNDFHVHNTRKKLWFKALNNFAIGRLPNDCVWIQTSGFGKARHVQAETGVESNQNTQVILQVLKTSQPCV